jgi:hypothetical protein
MCFQVQAQYASGNTVTGSSSWTQSQCATTATGSAAADSFITTLQNARPVHAAMNDSTGQGMDTAKIIYVSAKDTYYAVYSPGSKGVELASAPSLYSTWTPIVELDDSNASQPYLAQMSDGSFVLADEYVTLSTPTGNQSDLRFRWYPSLDCLLTETSASDAQVSMGRIRTPAE